MSKWLEAAKVIRGVMDQAGELLDDAQASTVPALFPTLRQSGSLIPAGTRINHNGTIKRAVVDLWDTAENAPDMAPTLWENIDYREGYRIIPDTITAGTAFIMDEFGWWEDALYKSLLDANVWTPAANPTGWEKVE